MRLSKEDIALLRVLGESDGACADGGSGAADAAPLQAPIGTAGCIEAQQLESAPVLDAPRIMFEFNLVNRLPSGALQLTKTGARALFQAECIAALEMALNGQPPDMAGGVERWLVSSGFLHAIERTVTPRGKLWLDSLSPEQTSKPAACPDQADAFAARRGTPANFAG